MEANQLPKNEPVVAQEPQPEADTAATGSPKVKNRKQVFKIIDTALTAIVFLSVVALVIILGWQIFLAVRPLIGH